MSKATGLVRIRTPSGATDYSRKSALICYAQGHNIVRPAGPAPPTGRWMPSVLRTGQGASPLRCLATAIPDHIHHINHHRKEVRAV